MPHPAEAYYRSHDTALIVPIPEAEAAVGTWRSRFDPSARFGVPAHVTVLHPFVPWSELGDELLEAAGTVVRRHPSFSASLVRVERRSGVVWLRVEPEDDLRALTAAVWEHWPDYPPYEGRFEDVIPHLTIAESGEGEVPEEVDADVAGHLPIRFRATGVDLVRYTAGRWSAIARFPLG
jgi:2'-5' RNA ligase